MIFIMTPRTVSRLVKLKLMAKENTRGRITASGLKNENIISWRNGIVDATVPDLICVFDDTLNKPCLNPFINVGQKISVIGLVAPAEWRLPKGLELFGPKHFGFEIEYIPLEKKFGK